MSAAPDTQDAPSAEVVATGDVASDAALPRKVSAFADAQSMKYRRAGQFAGQGYSVEWIAGRFGVTTAAVRAWHNQPAFLDGYASAEGQAARDAAMGLSKIALVFPQLVDTSIAVALDTAHKDSSVERRFLIDKILIPMSIQHGRVEHHADESFWKPVAAGLTAIAALGRAPVPQLLDGKDAAAQYGAPREIEATAVPAANKPE